MRSRDSVAQRHIVGFNIILLLRNSSSLQSVKKMKLFIIMEGSNINCRSEFGRTKSWNGTKLLG